MNEGVPIRQDVRKCRGCKEPIIWVKTAANDKFIPLNSKPERRMIINAEHKAESITTWTQHLATCSNPDRIRK